MSSRRWNWWPLCSLRYARRREGVAVDTLPGRPQINVDLASVHASGADLTAAFLKLATVIK